MVERLIVALDGSPLAERALHYAVPIARGIGARVDLLRVVEDPNEQPAAQDYLKQLVETLAESGITVNLVVEAGEPARVIEEHTRPDRDLVVLTSHGSSGRESKTYGSVAARVLQDCRAPLLLIRPWFACQGLAPDGERPVFLVPLDGSPVAEAALPFASELARGLNGDVVLLSVIDEEPAAPTGVVFWGVAPPGPPVEDEEIATRYLDGLVAQIQQPGIVVDRAVRVGMPAAQIADAANDGEAAIIVMTTRGGGTPNSGLGPVAQELLLRDNRPILFIRPA